MLKNRDILMELLQDANDFAKMKQIECPPIYLMGGSGCILGNYLERATTDIDLIDMGYLASLNSLIKNVSSRENFSNRVRTHFIEHAEHFKVMYHV